MKLNKNIPKVALVALVVLLSAATSVATQKISNTNTKSSNTFETPNPNVKLVNLSEGVHTDFTVAAELSVNAVVHVKTTYPSRVNYYNNDPFLEFFFGKPQGSPQREMPSQKGSGSGVIISTDGYIITNNHVINNAAEIEVSLNDKRNFKATLVGSDPNTDLALLKIEAKDLPTIAFGNSDVLKVGEWVLAVGNPFNLTSTVTAGIVSAKARNINILNAEMKIESFIQTDAAINPGNSGGALVNTKGELVGINTAIASQTGSYSGYGFAIPVSIVGKVVGDLKQFGFVQRAVLGIEIREIDEVLAKDKNLASLEGVYTAKIIENGSAAMAGLQEGDIIQEVNGNKVSSVSQLQEQVGRYSPGDIVTLKVVRNKNKIDIKVLLKNRQGNTKRISSNSDLSVLAAKFTDISPKIKQSLGIAYGVQVSNIQKGKFMYAGIKDGFIILKINNTDIRSEGDIQASFDAAINSGDTDKVLFIAGVYPNGRVAYYAVDLNQN